MNALKPVALVLACVCLLLVIYRLLKWDRSNPPAAVAAAPAAPVAEATPAPIATPTPTPEPPVWEWTRVQSRTVVFQPGEGQMSGDIPQTPGTNAQKRITIQAKSPVMAAFFPSIYRQAMISNTAQTMQMSIFSCLNRNVLQTTITCTLDTSNSGYIFLIKDERTGAQGFGAALMGALGVKKPLEDLTMRNDVSIDYWEFGCVRNCTEYDRNR